jgi:hypothetical protein
MRLITKHKRQQNLMDHPLSFAWVQTHGITRRLFGIESETWSWLITKDINLAQGSGLLDSLLRLDKASIREAFGILTASDESSEGILFLWRLG